MSAVDLTKCQPGDLLRLRNGNTAVYCGTDGTKWMPHSFCPVKSASAEYVHDNGSASTSRNELDVDVVAIIHPTRAELEEQRRELLGACKELLRDPTNKSASVSAISAVAKAEGRA